MQTSYLTLLKTFSINIILNDIKLRGSFKRKVSAVTPETSQCGNVVNMTTEFDIGTEGLDRQ